MFPNIKANCLIIIAKCPLKLGVCLYNTIQLQDGAGTSSDERILIIGATNRYWFLYAVYLMVKMHYDMINIP